MKKIIALVSFVGLSFGSLALTSCGCCTGESPAPALRPMPSFAPLGEPSVEYAK